jgi:hypothetical protein
MAGVLLLACFTVGLLALGHCLLGVIMGLPFKGIHKVTYWTLVAVCAAFGIAAAIIHLATTTMGVPA